MSRINRLKNRLTPKGHKKVRRESTGITDISLKKENETVDGKESMSILAPAVGYLFHNDDRLAKVRLERLGIGRSFYATGAVIL